MMFGIHRGDFKQGNTLVKKEILSKIGSNLTLTDKILSIKARNPFFVVEESTPHEKYETELIEPKKSRSSSGKKPDSLPHRPKMLGQLHDVRTYQSKAQLKIAAMYRFFERRTLCGCDDCRQEFFNPARRIARRKKKERWGVLPKPAMRCLLES